MEAAQRIEPFHQLGHHVTTLAGEGEADVVMPELAIRATTAPSLEGVSRIINDAELVVVENFVSLPLNVAARDVLYQALDEHRALFRHHDLPWQRERSRSEEAPRDESH